MVSAPASQSGDKRKEPSSIISDYLLTVEWEQVTHTWYRLRSGLAVRNPREGKEKEENVVI